MGGSLCGNRGDDLPCILTGCFDKFHPVKKAASWVKILCCGLLWCVNQVALISSLAAARPLYRARHDSYNGCATTMQRVRNEYATTEQRLCNGYATSTQRLCNDCATSTQQVHTQVREKYRRWYMSKYAAWVVNLAIQCCQKVDECDGIFKQLREGIMLIHSA